MPSPTVEFVVNNTSTGRAIFKSEAEQSINDAFNSIYNLVTAIPAGPKGDTGDRGEQGPRWVTGTPREFEVGLVCVVGNILFRRYSGSNVTALFRCIQDTTTSNANFPTSPISNAFWELILMVPWGERGLQGIQGERGLQGIQGEPGLDGNSPTVEIFDTLQEAITHSIANPDDLVASTEGLNYIYGAGL